MITILVMKTILGPLHDNDKECTFEGRCIFAHEESPDHKVGQQCERIIFVHESRDLGDSEEERDSGENVRDDENVVKMQYLEIGLATPVPNLNVTDVGLGQIFVIFVFCIKSKSLTIFVVFDGLNDA